MVPESTEVLSWRMKRRKAALALYVSVGFTVLLTAIFWLISRLVAIPPSLIALLAGLLGFAIAGELYSVVTLSRKIRDHRPGPAAG